MFHQLAGTWTCKFLVPCQEQEGKGKTDNAPLPPAFLWRLGTLQLGDTLARQVRKQLGLQPGGPGVEEMSKS